MAEILIRGRSIPKCCGLCGFFSFTSCGCHITGREIKSLAKRADFCQIVELPEHWDLIDRDAVEYTYAFHGLLMTFNKILDKLPTIVGADKELLEKAHKEFIEEASKNRAVKYEQEVKSMRDFLLELRDEAKEIKNGNVPFPERSGK